MTSNNSRGSMRPTGVKTPPLLTVALMLGLCILAFNYWSVSSKNSEYLNTINDLHANNRLQTLKRDNVERRSQSFLDRLKEMESVVAKMKGELASKVGEVESIKQSTRREVEDKDQALRVCEDGKNGILQELEKLKGTREELTSTQAEITRPGKCSESACVPYIEKHKKELLDLMKKNFGPGAIQIVQQAGVDVGEYRLGLNQQQQNKDQQQHESQYRPLDQQQQPQIQQEPQGQQPQLQGQQPQIQGLQPQLQGQQPQLQGQQPQLQGQQPQLQGQQPQLQGQQPQLQGQQPQLQGQQPQLQGQQPQLQGQQLHIDGQQPQLQGQQPQSQQHIDGQQPQLNDQQKLDEQLKKQELLPQKEADKETNKIEGSQPLNSEGLHEQDKSRANLPNELQLTNSQDDLNKKHETSSSHVTPSDSLQKSALNDSSKDNALKPASDAQNLQLKPPQNHDIKDSEHALGNDLKFKDKHSEKKIDLPHGDRNEPEVKSGPGVEDIDLTNRQLWKKIDRQKKEEAHFDDEEDVKERKRVLQDDDTLRFKPRDGLVAEIQKEQDKDKPMNIGN